MLLLHALLLHLCRQLITKRFGDAVPKPAREKVMPALFETASKETPLVTAVQEARKTYKDALAAACKDLGACPCT